MWSERCRTSGCEIKTVGREWIRIQERVRCHKERPMPSGRSLAVVNVHEKLDVRFDRSVEFKVHIVVRGNLYI